MSLGTRHSLPRDPRRRTAATDARGAILIVALLIAALIAVALSSYLNLNLSSSRMAKRTFDSYAALNLAEAGTEEAVWSFNRTTRGDPGAWGAWSNNGTAAWQRFSSVDFGGNTTGSLKVYVDNFNPQPGAQPKVVSQSSVSAPGDTAVLRMVEVTLRRRSLFANGLVARNSIAFAGTNASVDSWDSDPDGDPSTPPVPYSAAVRTDHGSVATNAVVNSAVLVNQANIWGNVATGGGQPAVGANGTIRGADTPANVAIDSHHISTDFSADFDLVGAPVDGTPLATLGPFLGTFGARTKWRTPSLTLSGTDTLTILGDVTLVLTAGSGTPAISVTGTAMILVPPGSKLTIYVEGDVKIAGRGIVNINVQPISCQLYGTNHSAAGQQMEITGNGALLCTVYAPEGDVKIAGNGDIAGAIVARDITLLGNAAFHFDEALGRISNNQPFGIAKWRELTSAADRARYQPVFDGW
jgi:hypothetical protein